MGKELKQLIGLANGLLKEADVGREYTMQYVVARLDKALNDYPQDSVLHSIAQVIHKQTSKGKLTTSQKDLYKIYNTFAGLNPNSVVKEAIGDLLYPYNNAPKTKTSAEVNVRAVEPEININIENNPLNNLFDKNTAINSYYEPHMAKLGKQVLIEELNNMGVPPVDVKVAGGNEQAIMYDAVFDNKLGTAHVAIPVDVSNGAIPPTLFFNRAQFVDLTAENLNKYIVENAHVPDEVTKKASLEKEVHDDPYGLLARVLERVMHEEHGVKEQNQIKNASQIKRIEDGHLINPAQIAVPEPLKDLVAYENSLIDSSTNFSAELVRTAKAVCVNELNNMGFRTQVKLTEATDNCLICSAELDSPIGKTQIMLPVEIVDERPQIPSLFYNEANKDKIYDFTKAEVANYLSSVKPDNNQLLRYANDYYDMTYNQLKEEIITGVATKNYNRAEQAINRIEDKFGPEYHKAALADYAKYLIQASQELPKHKCKLLITRGSIEPRCGHFNLPISRVVTNDKGECEVMERKAKYDNLTESTLIKSSKIVLT